MTDNADDQRRGSTAAVWLVVLVLLSPVLYFLSIGPVVKLFPDESTAPALLRAFYKPLLWLAEHCQPVGKVLDRYIELWLP